MDSPTPPLPDIVAPAAAAASPPVRRRDSLFLLAKLKVGEAAPVHEVRVRNLSEGGTMAEFDRPVAIDTPVALELRGVGAVTGRVAWCEQGRLGIAFDTPIDPKLARKPIGQGARGEGKAPPRR